MAELQTGNRVLLPGGVSRTVGELLALARAAATLPHGRLAFTSHAPEFLVGAAAWMEFDRIDGLILPAERRTPELCGRLEQAGFSIVDLDEGAVVAGSEPGGPAPGRITILTSGTTGDPKLVEHRWETLYTMGGVRNSAALRWLLTYQAGTYAWWQMITLLLFRPGQELALAGERTPLALARAARDAGATAISATPTFWRMVLLQMPEAEVRALPLQQITLGGEAVDQPILDRLHGIFPGCAIAHIYASTEAGAALVVRDGREGFPAEWLTRDGVGTTAARPLLDLRDGVLWIRSPYAASEDWLNTGDRCELRGDRVVILGRDESAFINVGGAKVPAHEVERVLRQHPTVAWCRVGKRKAPFLGELVVADLVLRTDASRPSEAELAAFCGQRLAETMVPRFWNFLDAIPSTTNLKSALSP